MHGNMVFMTDFILPNRQQNGDLLACGVIFHLHNWGSSIFRLIVQPNHRERVKADIQSLPNISQIASFDNFFTDSTAPSL